MFACAAEATRTSLGFFQRIRFLPVDLFIAGDHHLRDPFAGLDGLEFIREVDHNTFDLPAVVAVNGAGRIYQGQAAFDGQAASGAYLGFVAVRQFHEKPGRDQRTAQGREGDCRFEVGAQIHAGTACRFVFRQGERGAVDDPDGQGKKFLLQK